MINTLRFRELHSITHIPKFLFFWAVMAFTANMKAQEDEPSWEIKRETTIEQIGDYGQYAPTVVALATTLIKKDKEGFWQLAKSAGANLTATYILKYAIDKPRPEGRIDGHAFPSGHTSFAFQGASFLQRRYGWKYGIPAYAVASFVGFSRIEGVNDRHDGWDVLAGALVGIGSTYLFTTPYTREHFDLSLKKMDQGYVVGIQFSF
jgi:membrane-associated phospholipid phosphatase